MAKREELMGSACPVARSLSVLGDVWTLMILRDAFDGSSRYHPGWTVTAILPST